MAKPLEASDRPADLLSYLHRNLLLLAIGPLACGLLALCASYLMTPIFTARISFLPPQAQQSSAVSALASLGSIAGLPSGGGLNRSSTEQYVALLQSVTVADRVVDQFDLQTLYDTPFRASARKALAANVRIAAGRKDGLIAIEVDDASPPRAADIANRYVEELRRLTAELAVTEAQQRRAFFDGQLKQTRDNLNKAQLALQASGFTGSTLKTEPKATAESFAKLKAESVSAELRVQILRTSMAPGAIELKVAESALAALRQQLALAQEGSSTGSTSSGEYLEKYREFKYQETLFDLFARQLELARSDEAREGPLVQVVDRATPPEVKSRPNRLNNAVTATGLSFGLLLGFVLLRRQLQISRLASRSI